MALILNNGVRFTIHGLWSNNRPVLTTWHTLMTHLTSRPPACEEVAGMIGSAWATHAIPVLANNYQFQTVSWLDLASETGSSGEFSLATVQIGGGAGANASPYNGILVTKNIADKGRGKRSGRTFIPGLDEQHLDEDGVVSTTARNGADAALEQFRLAVNAYTSPTVASVRLVVAHTPSVTVTPEPKPRKEPAKDGIMSSSDIIGFTAKPIVSGLRRRVAG